MPLTVHLSRNKRPASFCSIYIGYSEEQLWKTEAVASKDMYLSQNGVRMQVESLENGSVNQGTRAAVGI